MSLSYIVFTYVYTLQASWQLFYPIFKNVLGYVLNKLFHYFAQILLPLLPEKYSTFFSGPNIW